MLLLTRLNGPVFALNPDLIERAESTPDTVITLVNGTRYVVAESLAELSQLVRDYRAETAAAAYHAPTEHRVITAHPDRYTDRFQDKHTDKYADKHSDKHADKPAATDTVGTVVELRPGDS